MFRRDKSVYKWELKEISDCFGSALFGCMIG